MLAGSVANDLNSWADSAGSHIVVPALLAGPASEDTNIHPSTSSILSALQESVCSIQAVIDRIEAITILSHTTSPIIHHIHLRSTTPSLSSTLKVPSPVTTEPCEATSSNIAGKEHELQDILDKVLAQDV
ncbi:hypothetical protein V8E53_002991 [Lactarius tabidus]